jgi:prepilin-type N-terminal cleavage/methylation domain-containing protein
MKLGVCRTIRTTQVAHAPGSPLRWGFTLIELLVVIAIIGVLAALIVGATMRVIGVQAQKNTELTVGKVGVGLNQRWISLVDQANNEPIPAANYAAISTNLGATDPAVIRSIWIKLRLKQQFPESVGEALNPDGAGGVMIAPEPFYGPAAAAAGQQANLQNSVCLALIMKNSNRGSTFDLDNLSAREVTTIPGTSVQYIIDDWKQPITFVKFPYNNPDLNPGGQPQPGNNDSSDPTGKLTSGAWNPAAFNALVYGAGYVAPAPNTSYFLMPYVWSTGGPANIPIVSYKSRIGGYSQ